jgi:nitrite reductase (NADH) large subunit
MRRKSLALIGNGMATCRLLDELIRRGAQERYEVAVFSEENGGAYNRVLLSRVLAGGRPDDIVTKPRSWYEEHGARLVDGTTIGRIDPSRKVLRATDGRDFRYDVAVVATGSQPLVPPIEGMTTASGDLRDGVFVYRKIDDCLRMRAHAQAGDAAIVLGGGLLGLEAAKVLSDLGLHVTIVHVAETILNAQLDRPGGEMLRRQIEQLGIFVRTGRTVEALVGDARVEGVVLDDGKVLPADMVVVACGVRPRVDLALASGLPVNRGILVNDTLATEAPSVYAVGECVEHAGRTYGIVPPVWEQASVLADVLSGGAPRARYRGSNLYARLKVAGVDVASMGLLEPELETDAVVQVIEERRNSYRKMIVRDGRLVGAMLVGDTSAAARLAQAFDRRDPLPSDPLQALCVGPSWAGRTADERTVCNCHRVSESCIRQAVSNGADSVDAVGVATRAGTGCGSCRSEIAALLVRQRVPAAGVPVG